MQHIYESNKETEIKVIETKLMSVLEALRKLMNKKKKFKGVFKSIDLLTEIFRHVDNIDLIIIALDIFNGLLMIQYAED